MSSPLLIIDCGATSCKYLELTKTKCVNYQTNGYSPIAHEDHQFPRFEYQEYPKEIYFFGTACTKPYQATVKGLLANQFPKSSIHVGSDIEAAARATAGQDDAYIHIIGTGSARALWQNEAVNPSYKNLGYIWEDYASGYDMGKRLIAYWHNGLLNKEEEERLEESLDSVSDCIRKTYDSASPKMFLAGISKHIHLLDNTSKEKLIDEGLEAYFKKHIASASLDLPHHFIGSIAHLFQEKIKNKLAERSKRVGKFQQDTLAGLKQYYLKSKC